MLNDIEKKIYKLWETQSYTDIIPLLNNLKCNDGINGRSSFEIFSKDNSC